MGRSKPVPRKKDLADQQREEWSLEPNINFQTNPETTPASTSHDNEDDDDITDLINDDSDEDSDFEYLPVVHCKRKPRRPTLNQASVARNEIYSDNSELKLSLGKISRKRKIKKKISYGDFQPILESSEFKVKIKLTPYTNAYCLLGTLSFQTENFDNKVLEFCDSVWLYVSRIPSMSAIYIEWCPAGTSQTSFENDFKYYSIIDELDIDVWEALCNNNAIGPVLQKVDNGKLYVDVHFLKPGFAKLESPSDYSKGSKSIAFIASYFFNIKPKVYSGGKNLKHDVDFLYKYITDFHRNRNYDPQDVQHPSLVPHLRPYQKLAVQWMLYQERDNKGSDGSLHPLFVEVKSKDDITFYYNSYGYYFVQDRPICSGSFPGGILADEMGLGKTVEVLACMLSNPRKNVSMPAYKQPVTTSLKAKFRHRVNPNDNIFTIDERKKDDLSSNFLPNKIDDERNSLYKIKVHLPQKDKASEKEEDSNEDSYPTIVELQNNGNNEGNNGNGDSILNTNVTGKSRRASRKRIVYTQLDTDVEDEVCSPKKISKQIKSSSVKRVSYNPQKEIDEDPIWLIIENVILENCWKGKTDFYKKEGTYKDFRSFLKKRKTDPFHMMSLRERLNIQYESYLAEYSAVAYVEKPVIKDFFKTKVDQKSFFECMCGKGSETADKLYKIQCTICSLWQHAHCVQYDVCDPYRGEFICPHCWTTQIPIISAATLIIAPSSISYQWVDEISKHLKEKSIRMFVYNGVQNHGYMQPRTLSNFDIVITTYQTLRSEVNYVDIPHSNSEAGRRFRFPKRFMATPSPLPCVEWWRICLDEAQMAECHATRAAEMALRLSAQNRWCVTGTPIQRTINDLQGLLRFLGADPYYVHQWWQRCLYEPYCYNDRQPLLTVASKFIWRNSKKDVKDEINIPEQKTEIHWLKFTPVEEHFYERLHAECSTDATQRLSKFADKSLKISSLDRKTFSSLLQPLLRLRQACNHPQIARGHSVSLNRKTLTMEHLLENLMKKTQVEAEDAHRILVASYNGLAAIRIIQNEIPNAVVLYRTVLELVEKHKAHFKTDSLQRLHTMHNLNEILRMKHPDVAPTLRDENLGLESKELRDNYLKHFPLKIEEAEKECIQVTDSIKETEAKFNSKSEWWMSALESFSNEFVEEVRDELLSQYSHFEENKCILYPIKTRVHLLKLLQAEMKKVTSQRADMLKGVKRLIHIDPVTIVDGAIDCHLRPTANEPPQCKLCSIHEYFEDYEEALFFMKDIKHSRMTEKSKETEDVKEKAQILLATRRGNWGQSEVERILRYLQTKSLSKVDSLVYEDSQTYFQVLNCMKKEFKLNRILWRIIFDRVSAIDEVNMATLRFRLQYPDEVLPKFKKKKKEHDLEKKVVECTYVFSEMELPQVELKLKVDQVVSKNDLNVKLGQLLYLKNLQATDFGRNGGLNPEPCPVCQNKLGEKWAVMQCGHSFCVNCIRSLVKQSTIFHRGQTKCPMCRQVSKSKDISYVETRASPEEEDVEKMNIQGSLSTKMQGIVRVMLKIRASDPQAKVLVFSSWSDALDVIGDAFAQNGVTCRILHANKKFQENLASFKSKQEITALLLPISSGANGLNLIEARYILLVDPILNPASELQALGRVHRIGQTKMTIVHRFLVRSTIEERMHNLISPHLRENAAQENSVTIGDLQRLFSEQRDSRKRELGSIEDGDRGESSASSASLQRDVRENEDV